jgi:glycosyltransferase involved in cell wall biosynthesis
MLISIVIRTLNEARYLDELLHAVAGQELGDLSVETVIVDSGSSDATLAIADKHRCRVTHIDKSEFTFGRSLNRGCDFADGDILVFISGHCVPSSSLWLRNLVQPIIDGVSAYSYGRQLGRDTTKFSERRIFEKYFPATSRLPQDGFFCNNANAALARSAYERYRFDEELTGLEDMALAKQIVNDGGRIAYVADAAVYHIHLESWPQVRRRYERESIALQHIMPEVHISLLDMIRYFMAAVAADFRAAAREKCLLREFSNILKFRSAQYWGTYRGNHEHRVLSRARKEDYYYPSRVLGEKSK